MKNINKRYNIIYRVMTELYDYQKRISWNYEEKNQPAWGFMEPGTGKTITSLALFEKSKQSKILVICILSKLQDWQDDLKKSQAY